VGINTIESRITEKAMNEIRHIQKKLDSIENVVNDNKAQIKVLRYFMLYHKVDELLKTKPKDLEINIIVPRGKNV